MDPLTILLIARILLVNTENLLKAVDKAKANDGKVTADEIPQIAFDTVANSLNELLRGDMAGLLKVRS